MDFSNRAATTPAPAAGSAGRKNKAKGMNFGIKTVVGVVLVIVLLAAAWMAMGSSSAKKEFGLVDESKLQAVFLNTGQVYFGNVKDLNEDFVELTDIYYLQTSQNGQSGTDAAATSAGSNVSLVKLGCELHQPSDKMMINRDQVTFWENLGDNGQVAKAVSTFQKQNPEGQKCADQSSAASTNSGASSQPAGSSTPGARTN